MQTKTFDLGHGWFANLNKDEANVETLTLRNCDKGQRIDLGAESLKTLRRIMLGKAA